MTDEEIGNLWKFNLTVGHSSDPKGGACIMDAISWFESGKLSDIPECVCPILRTLCIGINDYTNEFDRQKLKNYIPRLIGTKDDGFFYTRISDVMNFFYSDPIYDKFMQSRKSFINKNYYHYDNCVKAIRAIIRMNSFNGFNGFTFVLDGQVYIKYYSPKTMFALLDILLKNVPETKLIDAEKFQEAVNSFELAREKETV